MALPCTQRPQELEEEDEEENKVTERPPPIRIKLNLPKLFMDGMIEWYNALSKKDLDTLTKKKVLRKAINVAFNIKYPYDNLPKDWLRTLHDKHGFRFTCPSKKSKRRRKNTKPEKLPQKKQSKLDGKVVDLSNAPPPKFWMDAYIKEKKALPRELKTYVTSERTIIYYDYNVNTKTNDDHDRIQAVPHDRDGVFGKILDKMEF